MSAKRARCTQVTVRRLPSAARNSMAPWSAWYVALHATPYIVLLKVLAPVMTIVAGSVLPITSEPFPVYGSNNTLHREHAVFDPSSIT